MGGGLRFALVRVLPLGSKCATGTLRGNICARQPQFHRFAIRRAPLSLILFPSLCMLHESACALGAGVQSGLRRKELSAPAPIYQGLLLAEPLGLILLKLGWGVSSTHQGRS